MITALQHCACNVSRGFEPRRGPGFQTVALSRALIGTPDLRRIEGMVAYFDVSRDRRASGDLPTKLMRYGLPSGRIAVSRIVDWGLDPHGRIGNSKAYTLAFEPGPALDGVWTPFLLPDGGTTSPEPGLLEPLQLDGLPAPLCGGRVDLPVSLVGAIVQAVLAADRPVLIIGPEDIARRLLEGLLVLLPSEEAASLTFSTHFYRGCHPVRDQFRWVSVASAEEAPTDPNAYRRFELDDGAGQCRVAGTPALIATALERGSWERAAGVARAADSLRAGQTPAWRPVEADEFEALWAFAGPRMLPMLHGNPAALCKLLRLSTAARTLAEAVLQNSSPADLFGVHSQPGPTAEALDLLRTSVTPRTWRRWAGRWKVALPTTSRAKDRAWWAVWQR